LKNPFEQGGIGETGLPYELGTFLGAEMRFCRGLSANICSQSELLTDYSSHSEGPV